ncbi:MAG: hypothetical protein KA419_09225 [Acidobacteria bacterium]|nr:hypothetical protein [Acidobacteriota bacterium]
MNRNGLHGLAAILFGATLWAGALAEHGGEAPGTPQATTGGKKASVRLELEVRLDPALSAEAVTRTLDRTCAVLRSRLERYGQQAQVFRAPGSRDRLRVFLHAPVDREAVQRLLTTRALLSFHLAHPEAPGPLPEAELRARFKGKHPAGYVAVPFVGEGREAERLFVLVESLPVLVGEHLKDARVDTPENAYGRPVILFTLDPAGARIFGDATSKSLGRGLAIVLDGRALSVPVIRDRITDQGMISGLPSLLDARVLATALSSGALPADVVLAGEAR